MEPHDDVIARVAADTLAWVSRVEAMITAKQLEYANRMRELQLEMLAPACQRCPVSIRRVRGLARKALADVRELMHMLRDTIMAMPPQLTGAATRAAGGAVQSPAGDGATSAVAFVDGLAAAAACDDAVCPICLSDFACGRSASDGAAFGAGDDDTAVALRCGGGAHVFHRACLRDWARLSSRCPLCREGFGLAAPAGGGDACTSGHPSSSAAPAPPALRAAAVTQEPVAPGLSPAEPPGPAEHAPAAVEPAPLPAPCPGRPPRRRGVGVAPGPSHGCGRPQPGPEAHGGIKSPTRALAPQSTGCCSDAACAHRGSSCYARGPGSPAASPAGILRGGLPTVRGSPSSRPCSGVSATRPRSRSASPLVGCEVSDVPEPGPSPASSAAQPRPPSNRCPPKPSCRRSVRPAGDRPPLRRLAAESGGGGLAADAGGVGHPRDQDSRESSRAGTPGRDPLAARGSSASRPPSHAGAAQQRLRARSASPMVGGKSLGVVGREVLRNSPGAAGGRRAFADGGPGWRPPLLRQQPQGASALPHAPGRPAQGPTRRGASVEVRTLA